MTVRSPRKSTARSVSDYTRPSSRRSSQFSYKAADSIGFLMRVTLRGIRRMLREVLAAEGLTMGVWFFLRVLWEEDGLTQKEITERVGMMQPTAAKALLTLERDGFVELGRDRSDRRKMRIFLTKKGWRLKGRLLPKVAMINNEIALAGFSKAEIEILWRLLGRIKANVDAKSSSALLRRIGIRSSGNLPDLDGD